VTLALQHAAHASAMHHVIVGSGIAALSAAESIRSADRQARITMVSDESAPFYSRPGLAYLLTSEVDAPQLSLRSADDLAAMRIVRVQHRAIRVVPTQHALQLDDGSSLTYDRLLIATGAVSIAPDFPGATLDGVVQLDSLADANDMIRRAKDARSAVVVGGGSTALELVDGLHARGLTTHYLMRGDRYWSKVFDPMESAIVESKLLERGIVMHRHTAVQEAIGSNGKLRSIRTTSGIEIECEILGVAVGIRPRLALALTGGITTDRGILTNEFLETNAPDVFAAGDVAQVYDPVTQRAMLDTLWTSALQQGRIAGLNMAGVHVPLRSRTPVNVTRVGGITVTIIGAVGAGDDPDLLTLTRGQSERWTADSDAWSIGGARKSDRLRVVVSGRAIVGAVVMGNQQMSARLAHLIGEDADISKLRPMLEARPADAMDLLLAFCDSHVRDHAAHEHQHLANGARLA
jgi:NAD(P)H-nitrite reductase large subunit